MIYNKLFESGRRGGLMVKCLVRRTPDRAVRVRALVEALRCFLDKTLYSHSASLHPGG